MIWTLFSFCFFSLCNEQIRDSLFTLACVVPQYPVGHPVPVLAGPSLQTLAVPLRLWHGREAGACPPSPGRGQPFLCFSPSRASPH